MKLLLKHCDILAGDGEGYRYLADAYLSIDGSVIDYIGTEPPKAAYDREKDMTGKMLAPGLINRRGKRGRGGYQSKPLPPQPVL